MKKCFNFLLKCIVWPINVGFHGIMVVGIVVIIFIIFIMAKIAKLLEKLIK